MESAQLKNIQNIQNSLTLLQSKIQKMSKLEYQKEQTINKLILSTIPIVSKKFKQTEQIENMEIKKYEYTNQNSNVKKKNQESRMINEKEVARSKQLVILMKHHNSLHLKEFKKKNEQKIKKIKELDLIEKKERNSLVKRREEESQNKIHQFHQHKQHQLKLRRQKEVKQNQIKIKNLVEKMKMLGQIQNEIHQKVKSSENNITKFREIIRKVDKMKNPQFKKFTEELQNSTKLNNTKSLSEAILLYAVKQT